MDLSALEPSTVVLIAALCGGLCIVGVVLSVVVNLLGSVLGLLTLPLQLLAVPLAGDPFSCCGCLVLIVGLLLCGGLTFGGISLVQTCGTSDQVNLCRLLGY